MGAWLWIAECEALGAAGARSLALLSESERARHGRILHPRRQRQFLLGRLMLREMLARRFGESIEHWPIMEQPGRAPRLMRPLPAPVAFSIAHSHDRVACLLAEGHRAGCDIEFMGRARDIHGIASAAFDAETCRTLASQDKSARQEFFYRAWTRHEAAFKHGGNLPALLATALDGEYCLALALEQPQALTACRMHWASDQSVSLPQALAWEHGSALLAA